MSNIKGLIKNFSSTLTGNLIGQVVSFLNISYLARTLEPQGYGIFNFAQSFMMYFLLLGDLGLSLYCIREVNQCKDQEKIINQVFSYKFYLGALSTIIYMIVVFFLNKAHSEKLVLYYMGWSIFFSGIFIDFLFTAKNDMKFIGVANAFKNITWYVLCVIFVKNSINIQYVSVFFTLGTAISVFYLIFQFNRKYFKLRLYSINKDMVKMLKLALPLALSLFMVQINNNFDIIYLTFTKNQQEVGYYSAPYKIINFLIAILSIYFNAAYPTIAELFKKEKSELSSYISKFYTIGISFVAPVVFGGIALNDKIIDFLFGVSYHESRILFLLLIPLIFIRMVTSTYGAVLIMGEGSTNFSKGVMIGALINVVLNILLVPNYGAKGSAVATLLCESIQGIYLFYCFRKHCNPSLLKVSIKPVLSSIVMYVSLQKIYNFNLFLSLFLGIIIYFVTIAIFSIIVNLLKDNKRVLKSS